MSTRARTRRKSLESAEPLALPPLPTAYADANDFVVDTYAVALRGALEVDDVETLKRVARQIVERSGVPIGLRAECWALSPEQTRAFHVWAREQEEAARGVYTGAIGGALTLTLCFTSIGTIVTARHGVTKKELCLNTGDL